MNAIFFYHLRFILRYFLIKVSNNLKIPSCARRIIKKMGKKQKQTENGLLKNKLWVVLSGCVWANHWLLLEVNICSPIVAAYEKVIHQIFTT